MKIYHLVPLLLGNIQMSLAAHNCLVKTPQHFQCVSKVSAGFSLPDSVSYCSGRGEEKKTQTNLTLNSSSKDCSSSVCVTRFDNVFEQWG